MLLRQSTSLALFALILTIAFSAMPSIAKPVITATNKTTIILPSGAIPAEQTAAKELQSYLAKITGSDCQIVTENEATALQGTLIYVGPTQFSKTHLKDKTPFTDEEWAMQTSGDALILTGGRPRGTLHAVYNFLENVGGVRWWNPYEETVPTKKTLSLPNLNRRQKPSFHYRDIYELYATNDGGRFMARSRLNRQGDKPVGSIYGGTRDYAPPAHVHTVNDAIYIDPKKYYPTHPEWFLGNGQEPATVGNSQPAFSNPEMRKEFLRLLLINIRQSRAAAIARNTPPPSVFGISQNDNTVSFIGSPEDAALVKANGGAESAILLSFINYLADGIKDEFPDVSIDTLAYLQGERAPTNIKPRDNVIIRLTDTSSNVLLPITSQVNRGTREKVETWAKLSNNLRIWDYNTTYRFPHLPQPTMRTYPQDLRFYLQHNVKGVFVEFEHPLDADMRDLKIWLLGKLLENPHQDYNALVKEFTDGYYGAAGPHVRQYLTAVEKAATKSGAFIHWFAGLNMFIYLDTAFLKQADGIYAKAAAAVKNDPVLSRRVAIARASVDIAILHRFPALMREWQQSGKSEATFPLDHQAAGQRYAQAMNARIDMWTPERGQAYERNKVQKTVETLLAAKVQTAGQTPSVRIGQITTPPAIDAKLDDAAWKQGVVISGFSVTDTKNPAKEDTQVRFAYDAQNLYVSWRMQESLFIAAQQRMREVRINAKNPDDDVLSDDSVVLFIQPGDHAKMLEFNVNSIGTLFDAQSSLHNLWGTRNAAWNSGAKAAARQEDGYWTAELAIPWKAFDLNAAPAKETTWNLGLARHAAARREVSSWNQNDSRMLHEMTNFGTLVFGDSVPNITPQALPSFAAGKASYTVQVSSPMEINVDLVGEKNTEKFSNKAATPNAEIAVSLATSQPKALFQWHAKQGQTTWYRSPSLSVETEVTEP